MKIALFIAGLALSGCLAASAPSTPDNLLIIVIDTLRVDHVGAYGYARPTTPFIDSIAKEGVVFERAYSNSSYTRESIATLFTGLLPSSGGHVGWRAAPRTGSSTIAQSFREAGFATGLLSATPMLQRPGFEMGFEHFEFVAREWHASRKGPLLSRKTLEFVEKNQRERFMAYVHYMDPHGPYAPRMKHYRLFSKRESPREATLYGDIRPNLDTLLQNGFDRNHVDFIDLVNRYDAEIAGTDEAIRMLFEGLKAKGKLDNTLVVITADHGEEFLEHGFMEHAWSVYEESIRIPLILWWPAGLAPRKVRHPVSLVDLFPTLMNLFDLAPQTEKVDGREMLAKRGTTTEPVISELIMNSRSIVRSIVRDDWKYIAAPKWQSLEERLEVIRYQGEILQKVRLGTLPRTDPYGPPVFEALYNIAKDPSESLNLIDSENQTVRKIAEEMKGLLQEYMDRSKANSPENSGKEMTEEEIRMLSALGYL